MANTKLPARLLDTSAIPALNVTGDLTVDTTTLKVDSTNNRVGIGTASPSAPLHITHGTPSIKFTDSSSSANYSMTLDGVTVNNTNGGTNGSIAFHTHNGEKLRLGATYSYFSNTNVGIGTAAPSTKLTVRNDSATTSFGDNNIITLQNANTTDNSRIGLAFTGNTGIGSGLAVIDAVSYDQSAGHTSLNFSVYNGSWHDDMMVLKAGKVGIGTTSPADYTYGDLVIDGAGASAGISLVSNTNGYGGIFFADGTSGSEKYRGFLQYNHNYSGLTDKLLFGTGGATNMVLDGSGKLGIGTENPDTTLHVKTGTAQNDAHGLLKIEQTSTSSGSAATNAGITTKNHHGTGQFMQWEDYGLRIGSRILTNSGIGDVVFTAGSDSEKMRLKADGQITTQGDILPGADVIMNNGRGISFAATANSSGSMSNELLDDYEEGTWTPVIRGLGGNNATYSNNSTNYTKIGRLCHVTAYIHSINLSTITSGNYIVVTGLPYAASGYGDFTIAYRSGGWTDGSTAVVGGYVQSGQSYIYLMAANGVEALQTGSFAMSKMMINVTYAVA